MKIHDFQDNAVLNSEEKTLLPDTTIPKVILTQIDINKEKPKSKPQHCELCNKKFKNKKSLHTHKIRIHTTVIKEWKKYALTFLTFISKRGWVSPIV